jgi:DNA-binding transcriptional regulator YiaG
MTGILADIPAALAKLAETEVEIGLKEGEVVNAENRLWACKVAFGSISKAVRLKKNIPLRAFARKLGVTHVTVLEWERGERFPSETRRRQILNALKTWSTP